MRGVQKEKKEREQDRLGNMDGTGGIECCLPWRCGGRSCYGTRREEQAEVHQQRQCCLPIEVFLRRALPASRRSPGLAFPASDVCGWIQR